MPVFVKEKKKERAYICIVCNIPTAFSLMIPCALVFAAADIAGLLTPEEAKNRRRNEILAICRL